MCKHTLEEYKKAKIVPTRLQYEDYYKPTYVTKLKSNRGILQEGKSIGFNTDSMEEKCQNQDK